MVECYKCKSTKRIYQLKLIPTNRKEFSFPKYIPQIKELCSKGHYIRFVSQTPEVIELINSQLQIFPISSMCFEQPRSISKNIQMSLNEDVPEREVRA